MKKILFGLFCIVSLQAQSFSSGEIFVEVTNAGATLFGSPDQQNLQVTRISLLASGNQYQVFDYLNDADSAEEAASTLSSAGFGSYQVMSVFDNSYSYASPAYKVELNAYGWINGAYALSRYSITNIDSNTYDTKIGFEVLPFIDNTYGNEFVEYDTSGNYIRIHRSLDTASTFVGMKILSSPVTSLYIEDWVSGYNKSDSVLYNNIFSNSIIDTFIAADSGSVLFPSIESQTLEPGDMTVVYIALATGVNANQLDSNMTVVIDRYNNIITGIKDEDVIPLTATLEQNYPNPFNPTTTIKFSIPSVAQSAASPNNTKLIVYDILGREVKTLINKQMPPGNHEVTFDASQFASGVYLYRLTSGNFVQTKKMMLIK